MMRILIVLPVLLILDCRAPKTEVVVLGMIHSGHRTSELYSLDVLRDTIRRIEPDLVLVEIPPDRMDAASDEFALTGAITEPRVRVFPEYVDVLFPLTREMEFQIVPCAAWTKEMGDDRREKLTRWADERPDQTRAVDEAQGEAEALIQAEGPADNPLFIHTDRYDAIVERGLTPYDELFNDDLGSGGWTNINAGHYALIEAALDGHSGEGLRVLITFGAWHKYWFLEELRRRDDVELLDARSFFSPEEESPR